MKYVEGNGRGLIESISLAGLGKSTNTISFQVEIWTQDFLNAKQEWHPLDR
jgi:hypothetical protein